MRLDLAADEPFRRGDLEVVGQMPRSSNGTFLVRTSAGLAVYKPGQLERPLWDFPGGLYRRERAAYLVSEALGWGIVPVTVLRDGPFGPGSVQEFIIADFSQNYYTLLEAGSHTDELLQIGLFDLAVNNADRKAGHVLLDFEGHIWAIDNGLTFHEEPKLRTVIWELGGLSVPERYREDLARVADDPPEELSDCLSEGAVSLLRRRLAAVSALASYLDVPEEERPYPWPIF